MKTDSLTLRIGNTELLVVPAAHYNHLFAREVHRLCADPAGRPDAVAVELGPRVCGCLELWLRELGVGKRKRRSLPVMLGLMKKNRVIRPSLRDKALELQRESGRDLSELPPELLHEELGFCSNSVIYLSPTDSIIEAIRCAIELEIPVVGVDLDDIANGVNKPVMIRNPEAGENLAAYIDRNAPYSEIQRDRETDPRRERAMAARLKALLQGHRRVVFTCGMAHWRSLRGLLEDPFVAPAILPEPRDAAKGEFVRVIVHPGLAARYMDLFPAIGMEYEKGRSPLCRKGKSNAVFSPLDPAAIFHELMKRSFGKFFPEGPPTLTNTGYGHDLSNYRAFEGYLSNLCLLHHREVPDLGMAVRAAQETMGAEFARILTDTFMDFPWSGPDEFPDYPLLSSSMEHGNGSCAAELSWDGHGQKKILFIHSFPAGSRTKISYDWAKLKIRQRKYLLDWPLHTWLPWDRLISCMSLRAADTAIKKTVTTKMATIFEGSILDGIDIKSTLRASSRGNGRLYVRDRVKERSGEPGVVESFPVVWILRPDPPADAEWEVLIVPPEYIEPHARDKMRLRQVIEKQGGNMVAVMAYGCREKKKKNPLPGKEMKICRYDGIVIFQPICWTNGQYAHWAEFTDYRRNPFCRSGFLNNSGYCDLAEFYRKEHGIRVGESHWTTTIIQMAIPFAREVLPVAVPDGYRIEEEVYGKAKEYGVQVCAVPQRMFSRKDIDRLSLCYLVPAETSDPQCVYSDEIEKAIGERQTDNLHLVPRSLSEFGRID